MKINNSKIHILLLTLFLSSFGWQHVEAQDVSGTISSNATWGISGSPYYVNGTVTVASGATLTIQSGVVVKFANRVALDVNGTLNAAGATFTDYRDDSAGGDSNGDGGATVPAPGWWAGIRVWDGGSATLDSCVIRYGGSDGPNSSNLYKTGTTGNLTVTSSTISSSLYYGLYLNNASAGSSITGSTFSNNGYDGILAGSDSPATVSGNTFSGNIRYGIYASISNPAAFSVNGNSFIANGAAPVGVTSESSGIVIGATNTGLSHVQVEGGAISATNHTWGNATVPLTYYVSGTISVYAAPTLTIRPGTVVKFANRIALEISGTLNASGTALNPITFTDYRDDSVGGDTNGANGGISPAPGWWAGIRVWDGGRATFDHTVVRYGGSDGPNSSNLYKTGTSGNLTVTNSTISSSLYYGIYLNNASAGSTITGNTFSSNSYDGILANGNSPATVSSNSFTGNSRFGIYADSTAGAAFSVHTNTFTANASSPVRMTAIGSGAEVTDDNVFSGPLVVESGTISSSLSWINNRVYFILDPITINGGVTLTVPAGRVVKFNMGGYFSIYGNLQAVGTAGQPIYFTEYRDDTVGGDTNGDGTGSAPAPGSLRGLLFQNGGSGTLDYVTVRYAGWDAWGNVRKDGSGNLTVTNSVFEKSSNYGLRFEGSSGNHVVGSNTVRNNGSHGILVQSGSGTMAVSGNTVTGNGSSGIYLNNNTNVTVSGNTVSGSNDYGLYITGATLPASVTGNTLNGNNIGGIGMSADSSGAVIADDNIFNGPLHIDSGTITRAASWVNNRVYFVRDPITINGGVTLTVPAGRVVKFNMGGYLMIYGDLQAVGTAGQPIYFTEYRDDTVGGDTNGDGAGSAPAPGSLRGLLFWPGGSGTLDYVTVRYAGWDGHGNVRKDGSGNLTVTHSTLEKSTNYGLHFEGSSGNHVVGSNTVRNNGSHGILVQSGSGTMAVSGNTVTGNGSSGIYLNNNTNVTVSGNTVSGSNDYGLYITGATLPASVTGNTLNGNNIGGIGMSADSSGAVIADDNIFNGPLHIDSGTITRAASWVNNRVYFVRDPITINGGVTLTVPAGRVVKFNMGGYLMIYGDLQAVGTAGQPIYFTEYRDDTVGGDTNGDGAGSAPAPGSLRGLLFWPGGSGTLDYVTVRYAGWDGHGNVRKGGSGNLTVTNSVFEKSSNYGLNFQGNDGNHVVGSNVVRDNGSHGILVQNASGTMAISNTLAKNNGGYGLYITGPGSVFTTSGSTFEYNGQGGMYVGDCSPLIQGNIIRHNNGYGIHLTGAATAAQLFLNNINANPVGVYCTASANPLIGGAPGKGNNIFANTTYGVQNTTTSLNVNATWNWWGQSSGPYHPSNPTGTGNPVTDYVDFQNFLATPAVPIAVELVSPAGRDFGHLSTGATSAAQLFTVTNSGTQDLTLSSISITGANPGEFAITQNMCGGTLAVNASCTVSVVYSPTRNGQALAQLTVVSNDIYAPLFNAPLSGAGSITLPFRDDFTGGLKSAGWSIINETPAGYSLTETPDWLTIHTTPTDLTGAVTTIKNLFSVPLPAGVTKFVATTKLQFPTWPAANYQQGGLILLADKNGAPDLDNYLRADYRYDTGHRYFTTTTEADGTAATVKGSPDPDGISGTTPVWLRMTRQNTSLRAEYSLDGSSYTLIKSITGPWNIAHAGLYAINGDQSPAPSIPVQIDYYDIQQLPDVSITPSFASFGSVLVGATSSPISFTLTNNGPGQLASITIAVSGNDSTMFSVDNGVCSAPVTSGNTCSFGVSFTPASTGGKSAIIQVTINGVGDPVTIATLNGAGIDNLAANTTITSQPPSTTHATNASFTFAATEPGSVFQCSLDSAAFTPCISPKEYNGLAAGQHTFVVRAIDTAGNIDPTPASYTWTIDTSPPTQATTVVSGIISRNTTWTQAASPYYVSSSVTVATGVTLTVDPGTVIKFAQGQALFVNGTLTAAGIAGLPVYFTDYRDDIGGDSNGDGSATAPLPGWWRGIYVNAEGSASLAHCVVRYAGSTAPDYANLYKTGNGSLTVTDSIISSSANYGIYLNAAPSGATIGSSSITNNQQYGVFADGNSPAALSGNTISFNGRYGVYANVTVPSTFSVIGNSFTGNGTAPIGVTASGSGISVAGSNSFSGKNYTYIESGTVLNNQTWGFPGSQMVYYLSGDVTVAAGTSLIIQPQTAIKSAQNQALVVNGSLTAVGTSGQRIYFTDYRDDSAGGDSNVDGVATSPAPGWWRGIEINNFGVATLDYCVIRYGGSAAPGYADIYKTGSGAVSIAHSTISNSSSRGIALFNVPDAITVSNSTISNNASHNIYLSGAGTHPSISKCQISNSNIGIYCDTSANPLIGGSAENANDIFNNLTYGVQNTSLSPTVNATYNWWGASDGPKPSGSGNSVSNYVNYGNYLGASVFGNSPAVPGAPKTTVSGTISSNATWGISGSPYYVNGTVTVASGATLTIQSGVVVKFANRVALDVNGTLNAAGATFTDYRDDSAGGDSNGDGGATVPAPGWWAGIRVWDGGSATLDSCVIRYGGSDGPNSSNLYKTGTTGNLTVTSSTISSSLYYGLYLNNASAGSSITGSTFSNNGYDGILAGSDSPATVSGNTFSGNIRYGIYASISNPAAFSVNGNSFIANGAAPVGVTSESSGIVIGATNTGLSHVQVEGGAISATNHTWGNATVPLTYYVSGTISVYAAPTLTIRPGTVVKFANRIALEISGTLNASGTALNPITFTDYRDDSVGGDTNGANGGISPAPGWWAGIRVWDGGRATFDHTVVRYGGSDGPNSSNLYKTGTSGNLTVTNSTISSSLYYGIYLNNASAGSTITGNTFSSNSYDGILANGNSPATVSSNSFTGNSRFGIYADSTAGAAFSVHTNTFTANASSPVRMTAIGSGAEVTDDNVFSGPLVVESGTISSSLSWINNRVYFILDPITINGGVTLTVPAGRVVKFNMGGYFSIYGNLQAVGTAGQPIYFTEYRDDTVGGDTNGDGTGSAPAPGSLRGLLFQNGGSGTLDYVTVRYAGWDAWGNVRKDGSGNLTVTNSVFEKSSNYGLRFEGSSGNHVVGSNTVRNNGSHGILVQSGSGTMAVSGNTVTGNGSSGIYLNNNTNVTVSGNTVSGSNDYGLYITGATLPASVTGNTLNGNNIGGIGMSADSSGAVIADDNIFNGPLHIDSGTITRAASWVNNRVYFVRDPITINGGVTLTVPAGRVVKFNMGGYLMIYGDLQAVGTAGQPIYFTEYRDDTVGGDTNGDGAGSAPAPGSLRGLLFWPGGSGTLDYVTVRYAGWDGHGNVRKDGSGNLTVTHSTLEKSTNYGLHFEGSSGNHVVGSNTVRNNGSHGILVQSGSGTMAVSGNTVTGNGSSGIYLNNNTNVTVSGNTVSGSNDYGLYITGATLPASVTGNTLNGNNIGGIGMSADSSGAVIADDNIFNGPLHIDSGTITRAASWVNNRVYFVRDPITINGGVTLTVPAGRVVKFNMGGYLMIYGDLQAVGTAGQPIYFTEYRDDTVGGDTNGDGAGSAPAPGSLRGLLFWPGGSGTLDYVTVRYAGWDGHGNVRKGGSGNLTVTNSVFEKSSNYGLNFQGNDGNHVVGSNVVRDNGSHGILVQNASGTMAISNTLAKNNGGYGLYITGPGSVFTTSGSTFEYNGQGGMYVGDCSPLIQGNIIRHNNGYGIHLTGAATAAQLFLNNINANPVGVYCTASANPLIGGAPGKGNNIFANTTYGVQNTTTSLNVNATWNWWGQSSGPYHPSNPTGTGNPVTDYVDFQNFLATPAVPIAVELVSPAGRDFGHLSTGATSAAQLFTVTNSGTQDLTLSSISITGANPGEFAITQNMCGGTLAVNASCTVSVVYSPTRNGQALAQLTVVSNDIYAPLFNAPLSGAGSITLPFRDDFTGGLKSAGWSIINETPAGYSLTETPDWLTIHTTPTDLTGAVTTIKNLFSVPLPAGVTKFVATTKLQFPTWPAANYQQGGLILLADKNGAPDLDNYLRADYRYDTGHRYFTTTTEADGTAATVKGSPDPDGISGTTPVWLRMTRQNTSLRAEYSLDGSSYTLIKSITGPWNIAHAGLYAINGDQSPAPSIPVQIDYYDIQQLPDITTPDPFVFISQTYMPTNTLIVSNPVAITGINTPATTSITGGEYAVSTDNGTSWSSWQVSGSIDPDSLVIVRQSSSGSYYTTTSVTLTIGGVNSTFNVTTSSAGYPSDGLVSWWRAEGNTFDAIGGNHGKAGGTVTYAVGAVGQGFILDGSSQYVQVASPVYLPVGNAPRTVSLWFKTPQNLSSSTESAMMQYGSASTGNMFGLITSGNAPGKLYFYGHSADLAGTTTIQPNTLYHAAVSYDGTTLKLYLNGNLEATAPLELNTMLNADGLTIGNRVGGAKWQGLLDETMIYSRALSAAEIKSLYNVNANTLTIAFGGTGSGTVTANPPGISGNTSWSMPLHGWDSITLTATPALDAIFSGWSGGGCSGIASCSPLVSSNATVTATFTGVPPTTDFSGTPLLGVEPLVVVFNDLSGHGPLSWLWSFGDSSVSNEQHPSHLYEDPGIFAISLTAANSNGSLMATKNHYVTVTACEHLPASLLPVYYPSLQAAYDNSVNGDTIRARAKWLIGNLVLGKAQKVYILGGYDCQHDNVVGMTTLNGKLTIKSGELIVKQLVIR